VIVPRHADQRFVEVSQAYEMGGDAIVVGSGHQADAKPFHKYIWARLAAFALTLHAGKMRLVKFGRHRVQNRPGGCQFKRKSRNDRERARLRVINEALLRRVHETTIKLGA
jgi:RNA-directed DNA polymerase